MSNHRLYVLLHRLAVERAAEAAEVLPVAKDAQGRKAGPRKARPLGQGGKLPLRLNLHAAAAGGAVRP